MTHLFSFLFFLYKPDHPSTSAIENEIEIDPTIFPFHLRRPVFSRDTGQSYSAEWNTLPRTNKEQLKGAGECERRGRRRKNK
jgi:hypothetical protein